MSLITSCSQRRPTYLIEEVTLCSEHAHFEKPMIDEVYNIPVEKMFEMLFTESDFYSEIQTRRGSKGLSFSVCVFSSYIYWLCPLIKADSCLNGNLHAFCWILHLLEL